MSAVARGVSIWLAALALAALGCACSGEVDDGRGTSAAPSGAGSAAPMPGSGPGMPGSNPGASPAVRPTIPATPATDSVWPAETALSVARKVKNLLVGLSPNDADVSELSAHGALGLQRLIDTWIGAPEFEPLFKAKLLVFFRNAYQQTGFTPTEDFKPQLLENGGFDFGPFGKGAVGDDAFTRLVQNLEESFARTALQLIAERKPLTEVLTTRRFMLTTGLKSLYLQIEMPNDQPFAFTRRATNAAPVAWKVDYSGNPIPLEQSLDPNSPNFMVFDDQPPVAASAFGRGGGMFQTCRGGTAMGADGAVVAMGTFNGNAQLFQRMLGFTPRFPYSAQPTCWEHAAKPYFSVEDMSDWQWVNIRPINDGENYLRPYDLPALRKTTELALKLPRVGFYTTPAFLALWNTNDSNQHRVTANQTLLVTLGVSLSSDSVIVPLSTAGLDSAHSTTGSECYGCHKTLDPLREFWGNQFDFNDRNDYPTRGFMMTAPNPRPKALGGGFAIGNVNTMGASMMDLGGFLTQVSNDTPQGPVSGFAVEMTRKLCFYANSEDCSSSDPEFMRIARAFQTSNHDFLVLVKEFFASPLVTNVGAAAAAQATVSISRRDHLCAALSNRMGRPDLCALAASMPTQQQSATARIASSVAADAFSRGSESPITSSDPTMFYRAATEMLCENLANQLVDAMAGSVYSSANLATALPDMVEKLMGIPPGSPKHAAALQILQGHYDEVLAQNRRQTTPALRSAFVLACEAPTALSVGL
ncbi:MAG TPA: hypothetical protein VJV78_22435 [Polyangiales bacterium]|nr:hypothetical protein [Polyangiales bacterium]